MLAITAIDTPLMADKDNVIRIGKTRVTLDTLIYTFNLGATPEEIVQQYPALDLATVYAAIAYYLQHRQEIDLYLGERDREAEAIRQANQVSGIRERLLARRHLQDKG